MADVMDPVYRESRPVMPRNLTILVAVVLLATVAFMLFSDAFLGTDTPSWMPIVTAVVFVVLIFVFLFARLDLEIYGDRVEIRYILRRVTIGAGEIIDVRHGDLTAIRNYANWNLKGVKHRTYSRVGDEGGVAMKVTGKRVFVVSSEDPETVAGMIPGEREE